MRTLIFDRPDDWNKLIRRLHRAAPVNTLSAVCQGGRSLSTTTVERFRLVQKLLTVAQISFHTYGLKVEIIGISSDAPLQEIQQALEFRGYPVSLITIFFSPSRRYAHSAFLVKIR